jgi:hypothetical protein
MVAVLSRSAVRVPRDGRYGNGDANGGPGSDDVPVNHGSPRLVIPRWVIPRLKPQAQCTKPLFRGWCGGRTG